MHKQVISMAMIMAFLCGCAGQKLNKKMRPMTEALPMVTVHDQHVKVELEHVLIKNDPASWVKNASWDEYVLSVTPKSQAIDVQSVVLIDAFDEAVNHNYNRKQLKKSSARIKRKYQKHGHSVRHGQAPRGQLVRYSSLIGTGAVAGTTASSAYLGTTASAAAGAAVVAVPTVVIAGILRLKNHHQVQQALTQKSLIMPLQINVEGADFKVIFPAVPMPKYLRIVYQIGNLERAIEVPLHRALQDLHININKQMAGIH